MWQGSPCIETLRDHFVKPWPWGLDWVGKPKKLEMPELRDNLPKGTAHREWSLHKGVVCCNHQTWEHRAIQALSPQAWSYRIWNFPCWFSALTWPSVSSLYAFSSLLNSNLYSVPLCAGSCSLILYGVIVKIMSWVSEQTLDFTVDTGWIWEL